MVHRCFILLNTLPRIYTKHTIFAIGYDYMNRAGLNSYQGLTKYSTYIRNITGRYDYMQICDKKKWENVVISLCTTLKIFMLEAISPGPRIRNSLALCVYCTKAPIFHYNAVRVMIQTMIFFMKIHLMMNLVQLIKHN